MQLGMVIVGIPVEWIRLDPAREWLADVSCAQTELMLANQLQHSKDVHSQVHIALYRQFGRVGSNPVVATSVHELSVVVHALSSMSPQR